MPRLQHSTSALVAAGGADGPALTINLPQSNPGSFSMYELIQAMAAGLRFSNAEGWTTWEPIDLAVEALTSDAVGGVVEVYHGGGGHADIGIRGPQGKWYAALCTYSGYWEATVAAEDAATHQRILAMMETLAGEIEMEPDEVSFSVWSEHPMGGGMARYATMKVGAWGEVSGNYPAATRAKLEGLATQLPPKGAGGIVMLCGHAGTGKTRAIEALAAAWAADAKLGVVVDSDRLLGSASYLADVLTAAGDRRQVIVAEDCDDLVVSGPKSAATSKLLNIADGLVGRLAGGGTLLVLTANLAFSEIADYVTRPGRAAAVIEFERFSGDEANAWLQAHGHEGEIEAGEDGVALADLYATLATS